MIEVIEVSKRFGSQEVLSQVSFTALDGEITGFVGPNGAGKSTVLKIVAGTVTPTSGSVMIDGHAYQDADRPGSVLGAFLSAETIPEHMTAFSFLTYISDVQGLERNAAAAALELVGLAKAKNQKVRRFSLGMRQRLGIASVLVGDPQNLILDEPINGLDPDAILWLRSFLVSAAQRGKSVLLSSHHMAELSMVANKIVLLDGGRVSRQGPLDAFLSSGSQQVYFEASDLFGAVAQLHLGGYHAEMFREGALVTNAEPSEIGKVIYDSGRELRHLSVVKQTLEETYFETIDSEASTRQVSETRR
ncbi:ATP-binding cassette domain-containing protein [Mycetocola zhujimingii]|nr:ATP-binding cassette domain-containing protein [Mycetocola zhujimingii]